MAGTPAPNKLQRQQLYSWEQLCSTGRGTELLFCSFWHTTAAKNHTTSAYTSVVPPPPPLTAQEHEVRRVLRTVNTWKAAGADGIPETVLKGCADQLSGVLFNLFNLSLTQASIPSCLKSSTIIPIPKKSATDSLNDYRPIALTQIIMKCFERLVLHHLKTCLPPSPSMIINLPTELTGRLRMQ